VSTGIGSQEAADCHYAGSSPLGAVDDTDLSRSLHAARVVAALAGITLGLLCLAGVLLLVIRGRRRERAGAAGDVTRHEQPIRA
jgi:hypothetical protein